MTVNATYYAGGIGYTPADMLQRDADWISAGVLTSSDLVVTQNTPASMAVIVSGAAQGSTGGNAWLPNGYRIYNNANATLTISAAHATYGRYDLVVIGVDTNTNPYTPQLKVITGTASSSPVTPSMSAGFVGIQLAKIYVGAGVASITSSNITDLRVIAGLVDKSGNGTITSQLSDITSVRNVKTYSSLSQLGLTSTANIQTLIKTMPSSSVFIESINDSAMSTILTQCPYGYGTLIITKDATSRTFIQLVSANNGNATPGINTIYYCNYDSGLDAISAWEQLAVDDTIKTIDGRNGIATDANNLGIIGQRTVDRTATATLNTPYTAGISGNTTSMLIETYLSSSSYGIQVAYGSGVPRIYTRQFNSGAWGSWTEVSTGYIPSMTYAELSTLVTNSALTPGKQYILSNYATKMIQPLTSATKTYSVEQLVLTAISSNKFDRRCTSLSYPQDIIEYDFTNNMCEDGITARNGFILRRKDTNPINNLDAPFDWRKILWVRFKPNATQYLIGTTLTNYSTYTSGSVPKLNKVYKSGNALYMAYNTNTTTDITDGTVFQCVYPDITQGWLINDIKLSNDRTNDIILPISGNYTERLTFGSYCYNIQIGQAAYHYLNEMWYYPNNVFGDGCSQITLGSFCYDNTFVNNVDVVTMEDNCYNNIIFDNCDGNYFGTRCRNNVIGANSTNNTFVGDANANVLGPYCYANQFGTSFRNNILGMYCWNNTFGSSCDNNLLGNVCTRNWTGDDFENNMLADGFAVNQCGDNFNSNISDSVCSYNNFGVGFVSNGLGINFNHNTFGANCHDNTFGDGCGGNTFASDCYSNFFIGSNNSNYFGPNCNSCTLDTSSSYNTFGSNCHHVSLGISCNNNTLGASCYSNTFGDSCSGNVLSGYCYSNTFGTTCSYNHLACATNGNTFGNNKKNLVIHFMRSKNISAVTALESRDYTTFIAKNSGLNHVYWSIANGTSPYTSPTPTYTILA